MRLYDRVYLPLLSYTIIVLCFVGGPVFDREWRRYNRSRGM